MRVFSAMAAMLNRQRSGLLARRIDAGDGIYAIIEAAAMDDGVAWDDGSYSRHQRRGALYGSERMRETAYVGDRTELAAVSA